MSSRITNAIASRKARETLLRLLFPSNHSRNDATRHGYSHAQLRAAYLAKAHALHPDKLRSRSRADDCHKEQEKKDDVDDEAIHIGFVQLKHAWEEYDSIHKENKASPSSSSKGDAGSFTLFGVGCSFADTPRERDYRNEIVEMACRGWIPSGSLSCRDETGGHGEEGRAMRCHPVVGSRGGEETTKLCDDDWFVPRDGVSSIRKEGGSKSLVQDVEKFKRR